MTGTTLDAGALIAYERNERFVVTILRRALEVDGVIAVPAGVVAQVWRDGRRQARLATLLRANRCEVVPLGDREARAAGQLCGVAGTADIVDASVVLCARRRGHRVLTSDPGDLRRLDPRIEVVVV